MNTACDYSVHLQDCSSAAETELSTGRQIDNAANNDNRCSYYIIRQIGRRDLSFALRVRQRPAFVRLLDHRRAESLGGTDGH